MKPVGHLLNTANGLEGSPGAFYNYILAGNGLFVRAENQLLAASVQIALSRIKGLALAEEKVCLTHGRIPRRLYDLAISVLAAASPEERYLAVTWEGEYRLRQPYQSASLSGVEYKVIPDAVIDIHSHGEMKAFFSFTDDKDEQAMRLYMVVGRVDSLFPEILIRVGVYGYFAKIQLKDVFDLW